MLFKHLLVLKHVCYVSKEGYIANFAVEENFLSYYFDYVALGLAWVCFNSLVVVFEHVWDALGERERLNRVFKFDDGLPLISLVHYLVDLSILKVFDLILQTDGILFRIWIFNNLGAFNSKIKSFQVDLIQSVLSLCSFDINLWVLIETLLDRHIWDSLLTWIHFDLP